MALELADLTERVIGCAIEVHRRLGPGFLETIYEHALLIELRKQGLRAESQVEIPIEYDGIEIGRHRADLVVENVLIVELKAIRALEDIHFAVVRSYLRAFGLRHGLLLNFAGTVLDVKRVVAR